MFITNCGNSSWCLQVPGFRASTGLTRTLQNVNFLPPWEKSMQYLYWCHVYWLQSLVNTLCLWLRHCYWDCNCIRLEIDVCVLWKTIQNLFCISLSAEKWNLLNYCMNWSLMKLLNSPLHSLGCMYVVVMEGCCAAVQHKSECGACRFQVPSGQR